MAESMELKPGDRAPDFTLMAVDGSPVSLHDYRGRSNVILFFYPRANSPFCTAEACSFRDGADTFRGTGAVVIGISGDPPSSLERFRDRYQLPFLLLTDPDGEVRRRYGVPKTFGLLPGRSTFLIDREGILRHVFSSQFQPTRHAREMLESLRTLDASDSQG